MDVELTMKIIDVSDPTEYSLVEFKWMTNSSSR